MAVPYIGGPQCRPPKQCNPKYRDPRRDPRTIPLYIICSLHKLYTSALNPFEVALFFRTPHIAIRHNAWQHLPTAVVRTEELTTSRTARIDLGTLSKFTYHGIMVHSYWSFLPGNTPQQPQQNLHQIRLRRAGADCQHACWLGALAEVRAFKCLD